MYAGFTSAGAQLCLESTSRLLLSPTPLLFPTIFLARAMPLLLPAVFSEEATKWYPWSKILQKWMEKLILVINDVCVSQHILP